MPHHATPVPQAATTGCAEARAYALAVDTDGRHLKLCQTIFTGEKLETVVATDADAARKVIQQHGAPMVLVTELVLAGSDGFTLLRELRQNAPTANTVVIVVSAFAQLRATAAALKDELGIAWILAKDSGELFLRHAINQALAGVRATALPAAPPARHQDPERARRMAAMRLVDDGPPDTDLQSIVADTAATFGVPVALVSLVLPERQWFKAHWGLAGELLKKRGTPIDSAFCRHVVDAAATLVVADAINHPYFRDNPLVRAGVLGSYAGAPLITAEGDVLGTLCIIDKKPMSIDARKVQGLEALARRVVGELEVKLAHQRTKDGEPSLPLAIASLGASLGGADTGVVLSGLDQKIVFANPTAIRILGLPVRELAGWTRADLLRELAAQASEPTEVTRHLEAPAKQAFVTRCVLELERPRRRIRWVEQPLRHGEATWQTSVLRDITAEVDPAMARAGASDDSPLIGVDSSSRTILREVSLATQQGVPISFVLVRAQLRSASSHNRLPPEAVMQSILRAARQVAISSDVVTRWGPSEVLVAMQRTTAPYAEAFAERLLAATSGLDCCADQSVVVDAGVAQMQGGEDLHATITRAGHNFAHGRRPVAR